MPPERALAHAESMVIRWRAPAPCPTQDKVRDTVLGWLAQSSEPKVANGTRVEANVRHESRGFVLELQLVTPGGSAREQLTAARCETLADVVALKVALAADPIAVVEQQQKPSAAAQWALRASMAAGTGLLPGLGLSLALTGTARLGYFALELGAAYSFSQEVRYVDRPSVGAALDLVTGSARVCALPELGSVQFSVCLGPELGFLRGRGFGLPTVFEEMRFYSGLALGPAVRWRIAGQFSAYLGVDAQLALARPGFYVRNLPILFVSEQLGARLQVGTELHFD